jgi:hypothetical protein
VSGGLFSVPSCYYPLQIVCSLALPADHPGPLPCHVRVLRAQRLQSAPNHTYCCNPDDFRGLGEFTTGRHPHARCTAGKLCRRTLPCAVVSLVQSCHLQSRVTCYVKAKQAAGAAKAALRFVWIVAQ